MFLNPKKVIAQMKVSPYSSVLDVGAGNGDYSIHLAQNDGTLSVYAVDVQPGLVDRINTQIKNKRLKNLQAFTSNAENFRGIKLKEDTIDFVLAANILFQIENKIAFIKELSRVLKPGGQVLVVDWSDSHNHIGPIPAHVFEEDKVKEVFTQNNFNFVKNIDAGDYHYAIMFKYES